MSLIEHLRADIGDDDVIASGAIDTRIYSDAQLVILLQKSARRINRELYLFDTSSEISIDSSGVMTPVDGVLADLILLQAECLITTRDFQSELNSSSAGVFVRDGEQSIDTRQRGIARSVFFDSAFSPCAELKSKLMEEKLNRGRHKNIW